MAFAVRRLGPEDAERYQALRLEALERHPDYFGAAVEDEQDRTRAEVEHVLADNAVFGGFVDGVLAGTVALFVLPRRKLSHKGILWGMYVRETARAGGLADALMRAVLDHARGRVEQVTLNVDVPNLRAKRFYDRWGFVPYGVEPRAMKIGDAYYDTEMRVRFLDDRAGAGRR